MRSVNRIVLLIAAAVMSVGAFAATPTPAKADVFISLPRVGVYIGDGPRRHYRHHAPRRHFYAPRRHYHAPRARYHRPHRPLRRAYRRGYIDGRYGHYGPRHYRHRHWR